MVVKEKLEEKINQTERKLRELSIRLERFDQEYQEILEELGVTPSELTDFASNSDNFPSSTWKELQKEKEQIDLKLNLELNNVRDANKTAKRATERGFIQQHWLFVR